MIKVGLLTQINGLMPAITKHPKFLEIQNKVNFVLLDEKNISIPSTNEITALFCDPPIAIKELENQEAFKSLKWIQSSWAGVEKLVALPGVQNGNYVLTRMAGSFGELMAEYCSSMVVSNERKFQNYWKDQQKHIWQPQKDVRPLSQLTIGLLGWGLIAKEIGNLFKVGFKSKVIGYCNNPEIHSKSNVDNLYAAKDGLDEFLKESDYIINTLPDTIHTRGLLNGDVLSKCKPGCVFINVGRSNIIDSESLVNAINKKYISAAILDVFSQEPLSYDSILWDLEGITITPHISGPSLNSKVISLFMENLSLFVDGKTLNYIVDPKKGY